MTISHTGYDAITAKVRAMYGRRLTDEDWATMESMSSVTKVGKYLLAHPGWQGAIASLHSGILYRGELEAALRLQLINEHVKLYRFASADDKQLLLFPLYKVEYEMILQNLRRLMSGNPARQAALPHEFFLQKSKISFSALAEAGTWRDILAAVSNTIFYKPLLSASLSPDTELPDYTAVSVLLQGAYYAALSRFVIGKYKGDAKKLFLSALGQEVDLLNLVHIMRLKRYFPSSPQTPEEMLFPVHYKLRRSFFREISSAPDYRSAMELIGDSYYGEFFSRHNFEYIDQYYRRKIYEFNRKQLAGGKGSPYISIAYLSLKEEEMRRLFSVIEKAHYRDGSRK